MTDSNTFQVGQIAEMSKSISDEDVILFAKITGDHNPIHLDEQYARQTRFKGRIVHGILTAGLISAALASKLPGAGSVYLSQNLKFLAPVRIGETITTRITVLDWNSRKKILRLATSCFDSSRIEVLTGEAVLLVDSNSISEKGA